MAVQKIGQHVVREEDERLLRGKGRYVSDMKLPGEAQAYVLRSPHAHAKIIKIDTTQAKAAPGVLAVLTGEDIAKRGLGTLRPFAPRKRSDGQPMFVCAQPLLAKDRVRYVGDLVAFVVAETVDQAKDAAELIEVDYQALPGVITAEEALAPGASAVHDENPSNEAFLQEGGNKEAVDAAFATAAHLIKHKVIINRITANTMEPRGCIGSYDPVEERYTIRCTTQSIQGTKAGLAGQIFKVPHNKVRVICDNMGGGFGMKGGVNQEFGLSLFAAEVIGRPVRWTAERSEGVMTDEMSRGSHIDVTLALDKDGKFLALRAINNGSMGAYHSSDRPGTALTAALGCFVNTYAFPAVHVQVKAVLTNTMMIAPYRGGGRPEPIIVTETIIDKAAHQLGIDPVELRRRNSVPASAMPYTTALKQVYDSGDFSKNLADALKLADHAGAERRRAEAEKRGKLLGVGVATAVAATGGAGFEFAEVRFDQSGGVTLITGSMDHGQGHGTVFKQVLSEKLGIDADLIRYQFGDTDIVDNGVGTFGSRSAILAGGAISGAAEKLIAKGKKIAAHMMEAASDDVVFEAGNFVIAGTDKKVGLAQVARHSFQWGQLPNNVEVGFTERTNYGPSNAATFPSGAHICEVEIDAETGKLALTRYSAVDDVGTVLNPLICEGQIQGGIVQGLGQVMGEDIVYDEHGQLLTGSFMDYCMPRADDFCDFTLGANCSPTNRNPLGVKGVGEAGTIGAIPALMNAVNDALHRIGAPEIEMPATPEKVWRAIQAAR
jgi:aerobic carbon-monoxide dehydrogenase large subunit